VQDGTGDYLAALFAPEDATLLALREEADRSGLPPIAISPDEGRLLQVLLRAVGATRALPVGGTLLTLEIEPSHAEFARRHLARAGVADRVEVRVGRALDILPALDGERFDVVFLDADKEPLPTYFEWSLRLLRPGGLLIADNALWGGRVLDDRVDDEATRAVREFNRRLATDPRVTGIVVPTHDGVGIGVVAGGQGGA
jgi:predicted O-methyltransferase YrrM